MDDLFFETFAGDKVHWRWKSLFPNATTPGALYPRFEADYVALIPLNDESIHAITRDGKVLWEIRDLMTTHSRTAVVSESGRSVLALSPAAVTNTKAPRMTWIPNPIASYRGEMQMMQSTVSLLCVAWPPIPTGYPRSTDLMWQETKLLRREIDLITTDSYPRPGYSGLGFQSDVRGLDVVEATAGDTVDVSFLVHRADSLTVNTLQNWRITKGVRSYNLDVLRDVGMAWLTTDDRLLIALPGLGRDYRLVIPSGEVVWSKTFAEGEEGSPVFSPDRRFVAFAGEHAIHMYALN